MALKIYTKTGDKGETGLLGGRRVSKDDARIESYGTVDELNSHIGLVRDLVSVEEIKSLLQVIQDRLFVIGSILACDPEKSKAFSLPELAQSDVHMLETAMDTMDVVLPAMRHFIIPGGHPIVSQIHIARCVCRRAERRCVELDHRENNVPAIIVIFLNRLSDYLFVLSRYVAQIMQVPEVAWRPST